MSEDDYLPPGSATGVWPSRAAGAGLVALAVGCALLVSACVMMCFNVLLFRGGLGGIPRGLGLFAAFLGVGSVALMGLVAVISGARGWAAVGEDEPKALSAGGTAAAAGGLVAWLIAGTNLLIILLSSG